jgi:hypothetical protein
MSIARLFEPDPDIIMRKHERLRAESAQMRLVLERVQAWLSRGAPHDAERDAIIDEVERVLSSPAGPGGDRGGRRTVGLPGNVSPGSRRRPPN